MVLTKPLKKAVHVLCAAFFVFTALWFSFTFFSCCSEPELAPEQWYFEGLCSLEQGNTEEAIRLFTEGKKKGHPLLAPLCQEELLRAVGSDRLKKEQKYAAKHFADIPQIAAMLAGESLKEENDGLWINAAVDNTVYGKESEEMMRQKALLQTAFEYAEGGNWNRAWDYFEGYLSAAGDGDFFQALSGLSEVQLSLAGKILLYGYGDKLPRAQGLALAAEKYAGASGSRMDNRPADAGTSETADGRVTPDEKETLFLLQFYAGRLFVYAGRQYYDTACDWFEKAMKSAPTDARYDNALWYLADTRRKQSVSAGIGAATRYCSTWHDPAYFDDFLEDLCADLCGKGQWGVLHQVLQDTGPYMTSSISVQYEYICARAVETGLISAVPPEQREKISSRLFQTAWDRHAGSLYYRLLLSGRLGIPLFDSSLIGAAESSVSPSELQLHDLLLAGYISYGFYDRVLPLCTEFSGSFQPSALSSSLHSLLLSALSDPELSPLALRAASYASDWGDTNAFFDFNLLPYVFPQYYRQIITDAAAEFGLDSSLLFSLIRSESYFDAGVTSHAGAIGLSQLMGPTAGDVARKLKLSEYNLTDAETNARFGAFYLAELINRLDGDVLLAALSYNAGITNVRNWRRNLAGLPHDLFLEAVPYEETRGYGRKITTAYSMYAMLYDGASTHNIVRYLRLSQ